MSTEAGREGLVGSVWVIEQGSYSDYRVVGVFSTQELADRIAEKLNAGDPYDRAEVAEWGLDPGVEALNSGRHPFQVMMLRDGTVESVERGEWHLNAADSTPHVHDRSHHRPPAPQALWCYCVWATDAEHAVKIVNERRLQMIASGEWNPAHPTPEAQS